MRVGIFILPTHRDIYKILLDLVLSSHKDLKLWINTASSKGLKNSRMNQGFATTQPAAF